ncbi:MAG: hypothetical protein HDS91_04760 [Bacteroidales bacterium]|nr:hypothetical protein [Bacteroidales bacterium]
MIAILLETGKESTPEYVFISTLLRHLGIPSEKYQIITVGGKNNLPNVTNKMRDIELSGGKNILIFDADTEINGGGFSTRLSEIKDTLASKDVHAEVFLFPNHHDDGDFETMLDRIANRSSHKLFFDCFNDFECCVAPQYIAPNLKGKLHTYVSSQTWLNKRQRDNIGKGEWLFEEEQLWNLNSPELQSLKDFLLLNL